MNNNYVSYGLKPFDAHCCPELRVPGCQKLQWRLNAVWHRMLYSYTHMSTAGVKGL